MPPLSLPPPSVIEHVLLSVVLPAAVTAAVILWVVERLGGTKLAPLGAAVAFAAAVGLGQWLTGSSKLMDSESPWNYLPWAALAALAIGLLVRLPYVPLEFGWLLRAGVAIWIVWWIMPPATRAEADWLEPAVTTVVVALWLMMEPLAARPPGGSLPLSFALSAFVAAIVLIHAGSARLTDVAMVMSAALGGIALISWWRRLDVGGAVPGAAVLLPGLLLMGQQETFSEVPWQAFALAAVAPLATALTWPFERRPKAVLRVLRMVLVLASLAVAAALALETGPLEFE